MPHQPVDKGEIIAFRPLYIHKVLLFPGRERPFLLKLKNASYYYYYYYFRMERIFILEKIRIDLI